VIVGKFLRGFPTDDGVVAPQVKVVSMYIDQLSGYNHNTLDGALVTGFPSARATPVDELPMGLRMAEKYGVVLCDSIKDALCYDASTGTVVEELAVE